MNAVKSFAAAGGPVLGICNGFQILLEAGMLPGAMLRNKGLKFRCEHVHVRVEQTDTPFTFACRPKQVLRIPIAHGEGNYYTPPRSSGGSTRTGRSSSDTRTPPAMYRRGESERLHRRHRRHLQRRQERSGVDAASGTRV
jgi:hypothetical protein